MNRQVPKAAGEGGIKGFGDGVSINLLKRVGIEEMYVAPGIEDYRMGHGRACCSRRRQRWIRSCRTVGGVIPGDAQDCEPMGPADEKEGNVACRGHINNRFTVAWGGAVEYNAGRVSGSLLSASKTI